jgi:hypothetical protein
MIQIIKIFAFRKGYSCENADLKFILLGKRSTDKNQKKAIADDAETKKFGKLNPVEKNSGRQIAFRPFVKRNHA